MIHSKVLLYLLWIFFFFKFSFIRIAILDEPSSGLDPESRRELWNILLDMRKEQSILITTHYMEEAETLADKISIMSHGEVLCNDTAMQLKRRYAVGYILKLLTTETYNSNELMNLIHKHIPDAQTKVMIFFLSMDVFFFNVGLFQSIVIPTVNITLPYTHLDKYPELLEDLENNSERIGIRSIGMTNASLEEVFLKYK